MAGRHALSITQDRPPHFVGCSPQTVSRGCTSGATACAVSTGQDVARSHRGCARRRSPDRRQTPHQRRNSMCSASGRMLQGAIEAALDVSSVTRDCGSVADLGYVYNQKHIRTCESKICCSSSVVIWVHGQAAQCHDVQESRGKCTGVAHQPDWPAQVRGQPRRGPVALILARTLPLPHLRPHQPAPRRRTVPDKRHLQRHFKVITYKYAADAWPRTAAGLTAFCAALRRVRLAPTRTLTKPCMTMLVAF